MRGIEKEMRCGNCGRLLAKGTAIALEIKCPRCGEIKYVRDMIPGLEPHDGRDRNNADKEGQRA